MSFPSNNDELPSSEENLKAHHHEQFSNKHLASKFIDPCYEASKASMDCLNQNNYNRDSCLDYFQAYRDCKKAWLQQRREDRRTGRPTS